MINNIQELRQIINANLDFDYQKFVEDLKNFMGISCIDSRAFHPGKYIYRGRINESPDCFFKKKTDLSYPPKQKWGRANDESTIMWYGTALDGIESNNNSPHTPPEPVIATICHELKPWEKYDSHSFDGVTVGVWKVLKDIDLVNILMKEDNRFSEVKHFIETRFPDQEQKEKRIAILEMVAKAFSKPANDQRIYEISAAFSKTLLSGEVLGVSKPLLHDSHPRNIKLRGIRYPSAELQKVNKNKVGVNVALPKDIVDSSLRLETAIYHDVHIVENNFKITGRKVARNLQDIENDKNISWERE